MFVYIFYLIWCNLDCDWSIFLLHYYFVLSFAADSTCTVRVLNWRWYVLLIFDAYVKWRGFTVVQIRYIPHGFTVRIHTIFVVLYRTCFISTAPGCTSVAQSYFLVLVDAFWIFRLFSIGGKKNWSSKNPPLFLLTSLYPFILICARAVLILL